MRSPVQDGGGIKRIKDIDHSAEPDVIVQAKRFFQPEVQLTYSIESIVIVPRFGNDSPDSLIWINPDIAYIRPS